MLPGSHLAPINDVSAPNLEDSRALVDAFSQFIAASSLLESSYRSLQEEVANLRTELAERNASLRDTVADNERIRLTLQQVMDSLPCGVLVVEGNEHIGMCNPAARDLLGIGSARIQRIDELSRFSNIQTGIFASILDSGVETESPIRTRDGIRWLALSRKTADRMPTDPAMQEFEATQRDIWILRDITAFKHAEREREAARNAVALAETSMILAHEIRNPLASMELFAGLLVDDPERRLEWVANLRAGIRLLSGTVNNVLSMQSSVCAPLAPMDLPTCIRAAIDFLRPIAEQAGVSITFHASDGPVCIRGNDNAIHQIFLNLLRNAIRHTPAGGSISVSTRTTEDRGDRRAVVWVKDSGCGIAAEIMQHLFEAGFSGDGSTPGLGLAVCKRLVAEHSGEITVSSQIHHGTTFQLEFPAL